jgi:hypothetical protein
VIAPPNLQVTFPTTLETLTTPPAVLPSSSSSTDASSSTSTSSAAAGGGAKSTEGSASSTPMVAGAVVGSVGGLTVLLLIILILMRWYRNRRRALSVQGAGSNDSAANLAGSSTQPEGFSRPGPGVAAAANGSFRILGHEQPGDMQSASRRGIIPSPAFFSDRLTRDRNGPGVQSLNAVPYWRPQDGHSNAANDEISVIGGGPARPPMATIPSGAILQSHALTTPGNGPNERSHSRNNGLAPFPALGETRSYEDQAAFTNSSEGPSSGGQYTTTQSDLQKTPDPHRQSDGISVTSLYRDSWPPGVNSPAVAATGIRPLFQNAGRGGAIHDSGAEHGPDMSRPESLAIWPGPGAAEEIERWKKERAIKLQTLPPVDVGPPLSSLQTQVQTHLGDPLRDDSSSLHRETLRPSPARTPQVHSTEHDTYPFPERASPHDERNGSRPPGTAPGVGNEQTGLGIMQRKPIGGT